MLVLNRRPGQSIAIAPDVRVTVLAVHDRRAWIGMHPHRCGPEIHVFAEAISGREVRLEIGPVACVSIDGARVHLTMAAPDHPSLAVDAALTVTRSVGERVLVGADLWIEALAASKGNACISFGGPGIGEPIALTLVRPNGNDVRIGVDAPTRRVYREELLDGPFPAWCADGGATPRAAAARSTALRG